MWCPTNKFPELDSFADSETGTGFTPRREAVRDPFFAHLADSYLIRTSQTPLLGSAYAPPGVLASHPLRWCDFVRIAHFAPKELSVEPRQFLVCRVAGPPA
jgi:hypothetical protein